MLGDRAAPEVPKDEAVNHMHMVLHGLYPKCGYIMTMRYHEISDMPIRGSFVRSTHVVCFLDEELDN